MSSLSDPALGPIGRRFRIVPAEGGSRWTLVAVIAILAFLAALLAGAASLVATGSAQWRDSLSREATIQIRPVPGREEEADLGRAVALARGTPGILSAEPMSRADAERLLEPWLGAGLDLSELPVPRLVLLRLAQEPKPDLGKFALTLKIEVPGASIDDHAAWLSRLSVVTTSVIGFALGAVLLVLAASAGAIAFAIRGAVAGHRDVVEVLHFVGAGPDMIARLFAWRFTRLGLIGGLIGSAAAIVLIWLTLRLSGAGEGDIVGMTGWTYAAIGLIALADGAVAGIVTIATVKRFLKTAY